MVFLKLIEGTRGIYLCGVFRDLDLKNRIRGLCLGCWTSGSSFMDVRFNIWACENLGFLRNVCGLCLRYPGTGRKWGMKKDFEVKIFLENWIIKNLK